MLAPRVPSERIDRRGADFYCAKSRRHGKKSELSRFANSVERNSAACLLPQTGRGTTIQAMGHAARCVDCRRNRPIIAHRSSGTTTSRVVMPSKKQLGGVIHTYQKYDPKT